MPAHLDLSSHVTEFDGLSRGELLEIAKKQANKIIEKDAHIASIEEVLESLMCALPSSTISTTVTPSISISPSPLHRPPLPPPPPPPIPSSSGGSPLQEAPDVTQNNNLSGEGGPSVYRNISVDLQIAMENERIQCATRISELENHLSIAQRDLRQKISDLTTLEGKVEAWKAKVVESKARDLREIENLRTKISQLEREPLREEKIKNPIEDVCVEEDSSGTTRIEQEGDEESEVIHIEQGEGDYEDPPSLPIESDATRSALVSSEMETSPPIGEIPQDWRDEITRRVEGFYPLAEEIQAKCTPLICQNKTLRRKVLQLSRFKLAVLKELENRVLHCPNLVKEIKEEMKAL